MYLQIFLKRKFSNSSDKYAFGVTLWEIFSNAKTPFSNLNYDVKNKKLNESQF